MITIKNLDSSKLGIYDVMGVETAADTTSPAATNGAALITLGYAEYGELNSTQAEVWHPSGLISIPALPKSNKNNTDSAQCLAFIRGDQNIAFAFRDTRTELQAGTIKAGETCLYAPGGNSRLFMKVDNSISLYTAASATATGMGIFLDPANDRISIVNSKGYGIIIDDNGATIMAGGASGAFLNVGSSGNVKLVASQQTLIDGSTIALGQGATVASTAIYGQTGITGVASTKVIISP